MTETTRSPRRRYTEAEKAEALALAERIGAVPAAVELGIGKTTIYGWLRRHSEVENGGKLGKQEGAGTVVEGNDEGEPRLDEADEAEAGDGEADGMERPIDSEEEQPVSNVARLYTPSQKREVWRR